MFKLATRMTALACYALVLLAGYMLFGMTGAGVIFAAALFFVVSPYFILSKLRIEEDEKWFFSLFIGLGLFSTLVWAVGRVMSLRVALIVTVLILAAVFFFVKRKTA
ncbi:MAG: hypothetical protein V1702_04380 [Candidatus Woesearchaeota archaeon]